jgi:nucleotidyltransferase/DNA polymerase involved in DNA repair
MQKPNGLTLVREDQVLGFLAPLPVSKISGIGKQTERRLNELGIKTIGELAKYSSKRLYEEFGKNAVWLWAIANAQERVEVQENYVMRSIGAEHTFEEDTDDWLIIDRELFALTASVHHRLVDEGMTYRTVTLKIRFQGFETFNRSQSLKHPTTSKDSILELARKLSSEFKTNGRSVRLVGVRISGLEPKPARTIDAFT